MGFRRSFRDIHRKGTPDLIIDIRNNGGEYIDQEVQLARYLMKEPFRVVDTAAAITRHLFRLVPDRTAPNAGIGVQPDIMVGPDAAPVRIGIDRKLEIARKRIRERNNSSTDTCH